MPERLCNRSAGQGESRKQRVTSFVASWNLIERDQIQGRRALASKLLL
jgi:hypothetical protein